VTGEAVVEGMCRAPGTNRSWRKNPDKC